MKTIGLIGGLSWESTAIYYKLINEKVRERLGGSHSASMLIYSFDFAEIADMQSAGKWDVATARMVDVARRLEGAGADGLLIGANTMHRMADEVQASVNIPLIHVADVAAEAIKQAGFTTVGLLGTIYTMEQEFYQGRLRDKHGLTVLTPSPTDRQRLNKIIYEELVRGIVRDESRKVYVGILEKLGVAGAEGVISGCTEFAMLITPENSPLPIFDTTELHAQAAVEFVLAD